MKQSTDVATAIADLRRFDAALMSYLDTVEFRVVSGFNEWRVIEGMEEQSRDARLELEEAAGAAQLALERADRLREMPLVRMWEPQNWVTVFRSGERQATDDLRSAVLQAIGGLEREHRRLRQSEKAYFGLAGLLARFFALPRTVREIVGVEGKSGWKPKAATALGIVGQFIIAFFTSLVAAFAVEALLSFS